MASNQLIEVTGIGPVTARILIENGLDTPALVAAAPLARLRSLPGFGRARALAVRRAAARFKSGTRGVAVRPAPRRARAPESAAARAVGASSKAVPRVGAETAPPEDGKSRKPGAKKSGRKKDGRQKREKRGKKKHGKKKRERAGLEKDGKGKKKTGGKKGRGGKKRKKR